MDITATFQLTAREFRRAIRNSPGVRRLMIASMLMVAVGVFNLLGSDPTRWIIYYGIGIYIVLEVFAVHIGARKSAALFSEPWTVHITEQTYTLQTAASQAEVDWSVYREARCRSGFWYLRQITGASGFFPKRAFDDVQQAELAEFFARRLPPEKKHWYNPLSW